MIVKRKFLFYKRVKDPISVTFSKLSDSHQVLPSICYWLSTISDDLLARIQVRLNSFCFPRSVSSVFCCLPHSSCLQPIQTIEHYPSPPPNAGIPRPQNHVQLTAGYLGIGPILALSTLSGWWWMWKKVIRGPCLCRLSRSLLRVRKGGAADGGLLTLREMKKGQDWAEAAPLELRRERWVWGGLSCWEVCIWR